MTDPGDRCRISRRPIRLDVEDSPLQGEPNNAPSRLNILARRGVWLSYFLFMTVAILLPSDYLPDWLRGEETVVGPIGAKDKILHAGSFAVLAFLSAWAFQRKGKAPSVVGIALGCLAYAAATEIAQGLLGWRTADFADLIADMVGVGLGLAAARIAGLTSVRRV